MFPHTRTETEILNEKIRDDAPNMERIITSYINAHERKLPDITEGVRYYYAQNDIRDRKMYTYETGEKRPDPEATNNRLPSGFSRVLTDQKSAYLAGEPLTIAHTGEDERGLQAVKDKLGAEFDDIVPELVKNATNKGREWLHPYIDKVGAFDYIRIPEEQSIPIFDDSKRRELVAFIRYYRTPAGIVKVEYWEKYTVTFYEMHGGTVVEDVEEDPNPAGHFYYMDEKQNVEAHGWGKVPFVEFCNNEETIPDIRFYKEYVDAYDKIMSDSVNTLEDMQTLIYVLKGYGGEDLGEFVEMIKKYKAVKVDGDNGGMETIQADVPIEAVKEQLARIQDDIFQYAEGVDFSVDKFGNNPTGVALKILFSNLDMKSNIMERKFTKALREFTWFITEYLSFSENIEVDHNKIEYTFNKSMLMNEAEQVQMAQNSYGIISNETIYENHPWVKDVEREKERKEDEADSYTAGRGSVGGRGNDPGGRRQPASNEPFIEDRQD